MPEKLYPKHIDHLISRETGMSLMIEDRERFYPWIITHPAITRNFLVWSEESGEVLSREEYIKKYEGGTCTCQ